VREFSSNAQEANLKVWIEQDFRLIVNDQKGRKNCTIRLIDHRLKFIDNRWEIADLKKITRFVRQCP
jgi:hypothetical protein